MKKKYGSSTEHILDELKLLDVRLELAIRQFRRNILGRAQSELSGVVISDEEVDQLLQDNKSGSLSLSSQNSKVSEAEDRKLVQMADMLKRQIDERKRQSLKSNMELRLEALSQLFSLSPFETDIVIICLALEVDIKYHTLYAYLHDNVTKKRPTADLIFRLYSFNISDRVNYRKYFLESAPLFASQILEDSSDDEKGLLSKPFMINPAIANFVLEGDLRGENVAIQDQEQEDRHPIFIEVPTYDTKISPFTKLVKASNIAFSCQCHARLKEKLIKYLTNFSSFSSLSLQANVGTDPQSIAYNNSCLVLIGLDGQEKKELVTSVCYEIGIPFILNLDLDLFLTFMSHSITTSSLSGMTNSFIALREILGRFFQEAMLHKAALFVENLHLLYGGDEEKKRAIRYILSEMMRNYSSEGIVLGGSGEQISNDLFLNNFSNIIQVDLPTLSPEVVEEAWRDTLKGYSAKITEVEINEIANRYSYFTFSQIQAAVEAATRISALETGEPCITVEYLDLASAQIARSKRLETLSTRIKPSFTLQDLVLPESNKEQLMEIIAYMKFKRIVYYQWGLQEKLHLPDGINILFSGEPGTGKTMAAEVLASELKMELYKIDLSAIVSKYIGETEKNLNVVFQEAENTNAIIFFDEADAIFGKRTEIRDAHDRYANIEVDFLLQKMEDHRGIVILASNFSDNIDDAFVRRMQHILKFPFPDFDSRLQIWSKIFPAKEDLLEPELDFEFLARTYHTSGALIKNIAVSAAFMAAAASGKVGMKQLLLATKREFAKNGKPFTNSDFGKYQKKLFGDTSEQ